MCLFSASPAVTGPYCCAAGSLNHKAPAQEAFHLRLLEVCQQVLREVRSPGGPKAPRAPHLTVFQRPRVPEICNRLVLCNVLVYCTILLDKAPPFWWQVKTELGIPPKKSHEDPSPGLSPGSLHVLSLHKPVWFMTSRMLQQVSLQIVSRWAWCLVGNVWTHLKQKQSRKLFSLWKWSLRSPCALNVRFRDSAILVIIIWMWLIEGWIKTFCSLAHVSSAEQGNNDDIQGCSQNDWEDEG